MSRYPSYVEYVDSGVEWLGQIPAHWTALPLKRVTRFAYGESLQAEKRIDGEVNVYGSNGVVGTHEQANTGAPVIIVGRKGSFGKLTFSVNAGFAIDTTYFIDHTQTQSNLRWLYHMLSCLELDSSSKDSAVPGLAREEAYEKICPLPPLPEQQAIARFLDHKTAQIDALIAKREALLAKLAEKRIALISQAVTRGLDPAAPLKDSGVEWLGQIPAGWEVLQLKHKWRVIDCKHKTVEFIDDGYPIASIGEVRNHQFSLEFAKRASYEDYLDLIEGRKPEKGDLIYSRNATVGSVGFVNQAIDFCLGQDVCLIKAGFGDSRFLWWQLQSKFILDQLQSIFVGATFKRINVADIKAYLVCYPPITEQHAIAQFLDEQTAKIDQQKTKIEHAIAKLKEYRAALITSAVTGKIDVRNTPNP